MINLYDCRYRALSLCLMLLIFLGTLTLAPIGAETARAEGTHDFIYADADDFTRIKELGYGENEYITNWYQDIKLKADALLKTTPSKTYPTSFGERTLSWGVDSEKIIMATALVYLVENDDRYAERAKSELMSLCEKSYWGNVLLDNSASARAASIGYSWLYDYLGDDRETVKEAIYNNALYLAKDIYVNSAAYADSSNSTGTRQDGAMFGTGNHSSHNNAHYAVVAAALIDDYPTECEIILTNAEKEISEIFEAVFQDGVYNEGVGYWNYFLPPILRMISALESIGRENPFAKYNKLISDSAYFTLYTEGTEGEMVYADMYNKDYPIAEELYYAGILTGDKNLQKIIRNKDNPDALLMPIWFDADINLGSAYTGIVRDKFYPEGTLASMRSSWDDMASFVGFRGGKANSTHMDASSGTFTFDALGERWTSPLGLDSYSLDGYTSFTEKTANGLWRWDYYVNRAEANNCLVINPDAGPGQDINAVPVLENTASTADYGTATLDLTDIYTDATSYKRTVKLFEGRKNLSVKDVLSLNKSSEIFWLMNTKADISLINGGESAILTLGDKKLKAEIKSDNADCKFTVLNSGPATRENDGLGYVPTLVSDQIQLSGKDAASVEGVKRLAIHLENVTSLDLEVILTPMWSWQDGDEVTLITDKKAPDCNTYVTDIASNVIMKAQEFYSLQKSTERNSILHYDFDVSKYIGKNITNAKLYISVKPYGSLPLKMSAVPQLNTYANTEDICYSGYNTQLDSDSHIINGKWLSSKDFTRISIDVTAELKSALANGNRLTLSIFGGDSLSSQLIVASNRNSVKPMRPQLEVQYGE